MSRLYLLLPLLFTAIVIDLWLRLHTPAEKAPPRADSQLYAAQALQRLQPHDLPPLFDPFYSEASSARQNAVETDTDQAAEHDEPTPAHYRLLALRVDADGSRRAIISLQTDPKADADILTLLPGEPLGDGRLLTIEPKAVLIESATGETRRLILFEPATQDSPDSDN